MSFEDLYGNAAGLLEKTFGQALNPPAAFGGLGGMATSPGFALQALGPLYELARRGRQRNYLAGILRSDRGYGEATGIPDVPDPTEQLTAASLGDLSNQERLQTSDLTNRFAALGRSPTDTAFGDAASRLHEGFGRAREQAIARARAAGAGIVAQNRGQQQSRLQQILQYL